MDKECNNLLSFIADELNEKEKKAFTEHLINCPECTREYDQMTEAWSSLKWDFEEIDPPASLKSEVMNFVFEEEHQIPARKARKWRSFFQSQFSPAAAGALLAFLVLVITLLYSNAQLKKELAAIELPVDVAETLLLQAVDENVNTVGAAFILQQGEERSLVVQIRNMPELEGSEVYQVWLLNDGERANAGIFKPDETGAGMLTYRLARNDQFNQIGITKEPDPNGAEPRGKKIVGSS